MVGFLRERERFSRLASFIKTLEKNKAFWARQIGFSSSPTVNRRKCVFFVGTLFIALAGCIHLVRCFPPVLPQQDSTYCISSFHEIGFHSDSDDKTDGFSWDWEGDSGSHSQLCGFRKSGRFDVSDRLNVSWVVVAGDSQARLFVLSLLDLVLGSTDMASVKEDLFKRHSDYRIVVEEIGLKLDFLWAPYVANLTELVHGLEQNATLPNVLVMGSGLWHMLHVTNHSDYGVSLRALGDSLVSYPGRSRHLFWLGMPTLVTRMLNTDEKREKMTGDTCKAYNRELYRSGILRGHGGPFLLLDVRKLSSKCGARCSVDGMHYDGVVYEALVHVMLNVLRIEPRQKL